MFNLLKSMLITSLFGLTVVPAHAAGSPAEMIQTYMQAWGETSAEKRLQLLKKSVSDQVKYLDPYSSAHNRAELDSVIQGNQKLIAGLRGELVGTIKQTGNAVLYEWQLYNGAGDMLFYGTDAAAFNDDGRLQRIDGFMNVRLQ